MIGEQPAPRLEGVGVKFTQSDEQWRAAENEFNELMQNNPDAVLVLQLGPYVELDVDALLQQHFHQRCHVTAMHGAGGERLGAFVVTASRRNDAAYMFRRQLREFRTPFARCGFSGYWSPMRSARDLRALAIDGLLQRNRIVPAGQEIRPGVWAGEGARIARGARVLAPAFVGAHCRVRRNAVVTRCSALEHHSSVECGTVIENSTLLPFTQVGAGLDINGAVIGNKRLVHLRREVEVAIEDPKFLDTAAQSTSWRALRYAVALAGYLPAQFLRGVFATSHRGQPAQLPAAIKAPSPALKTPAAFQAPATAEAGRFPAK